LPDAGAAGVHDDRPGFAIGLGKCADALEIEIAACEIEIIVL